MRGRKMESTTTDTSVRIKVEPISSINSGGISKYLPAAVKKEFGTGRLASFKPPRDLNLSGATSHLSSLKGLNSQSQVKKNFVPNVNVTRRKGPAAHVIKESASSENKSNSNNLRRNQRNKGNFVQTQGVFSEGLAPGKPKEFNRSHETTPVPQLEKPKLNLNKVYDKKKEEKHMKTLLKDDFIDDPTIQPDITDCPKSLPLLFNAKPLSFNSLDETFDALQVKTEKPHALSSKELVDKTPDMASFFLEPSDSPRFVVFDFPEEVERPDEKKPPGKRDNTSKTESVPSKKSCHRLSSVGEGLWGSLRVFDDGSACILVGGEELPVTMIRHCPKQDVMSVGIDSATSRGEIINLGPVSANFKCSTDLSFLERDSKS